MIKCTNYVFITLVTMCLVTTSEASVFPSKPILRAGAPEINYIQNSDPDQNNFDSSEETNTKLQELASLDKALLVLDKPKHNLKNRNLKSAFNNMVESVAKVNDGRMRSLKKYLMLDSYSPKVTRTKAKNPVIAYIVSNRPDNSKILHEDQNTVFVKNNLVNIKDNEELAAMRVIDILGDAVEAKYTHDNTNTYSEEYTEEDILRGWKGCGKSAKKSCQKACKKAFKEVCYDFMCSKKMKKEGKKLCKKKCSAEFLGNDDSDSDSDYR